MTGGFFFRALTSDSSAIFTPSSVSSALDEAGGDVQELVEISDPAGNVGQRSCDVGQGGGGIGEVVVYTEELGIAGRIEVAEDTDGSLGLVAEVADGSFIAVGNTSGCGQQSEEQGWEQAETGGGSRQRLGVGAAARLEGWLEHGWLTAG
ncbi:MAG TPA: hypothetical protein VNY29_06550 [Terriglobales bacterium]|nr:hypothetical protein [Terriglobales bacterium]